MAAPGAPPPPLPSQHCSSKTWLPGWMRGVFEPIGGLQPESPAKKGWQFWHSATGGTQPPTLPRASPGEPCLAQVMLGWHGFGWCSRTATFLVCEGVFVNTKAGSRERGAAWLNVASALMAESLTTTLHSVRDRYHILVW